MTFEETYHVGQEAYYKNIARNENPYMCDHINYDYWNLGWEDSRWDVEKVNDYGIKRKF